jgi:hypothetical protein
VTAPRKQRPVQRWRDAVLSPTCDLPATLRLVALALAQYADWDTLEDARPGPARLAAMTGASSRTVKRALGELVRRGYITQTSRGGTTAGGKQLASVYRLIPRDTTSPVTHEHQCQESADPVTLTTGPRDTDDQTPCHGGTATSQETRSKTEFPDHAASAAGRQKAPAASATKRRTRRDPRPIADFAALYPGGAVINPSTRNGAKP